MKWSFGLRGWVRLRSGRGIAWKPRWDELLFSQRLGITPVYRVGPLYVWGLSADARLTKTAKGKAVGSALDRSSS